MDDRGADAATDAYGVAALEQLRRLAERPGDVGDGVADAERRQLVGALADRLDDQRDRARGSIDVRDRERDALRARPATNDHELPGLADLGYALSFYDESGDVG